jgi:hypothetical protein
MESGSLRDDCSYLSNLYQSFHHPAVAQLRLINTDRLEPDSTLARQALNQERNIGADHGGDLGISADRLPVGYHDDGASVGRRLHRSQRDAVGDDM